MIALLATVAWACDGDADHVQAMVSDAMVSGEVLDLRGTWCVDETVTITTPARGRVIGGEFRVEPGANLSAVVVLDLGKDTVVEGTLSVVGASTGGAWLNNRQADDGIHILNANGASIERIVVDYVRRYGVRTGGGNTIGASIDSILATYAGTSGLTGDPAYARQSSTATNITRTGSSASPVQRAVVSTSSAISVLPGDYLLVGGDMVEVVASTGTEVTVYPWPKVLGTGTWPVEVVAGGAVRLHGGNTAAMRIGSVKLQHGGHVAHVTSLYGGQVGTILGEVVGTTLTVGSRNAAVLVLSVLGPLHSEIDLYDVVVGGTGVASTVVISPTQLLVPPRTLHITPTVVSATGEATSAPYPWPVTSVP